MLRCKVYRADQTAVACLDAIPFAVGFVYTVLFRVLDRVHYISVFFEEKNNNDKAQFVIISDRVHRGTFTQMSKKLHRIKSVTRIDYYAHGQ